MKPGAATMAISSIASSSCSPPRRCPPPAIGAALADVDHLAAARRRCRGSRRPPGPAGCSPPSPPAKSRRNSRPVVDRHRLVQVGGAVRRDADERGGAGARRPDRSGAARDLLDIDAGGEVSGHRSSCAGGCQWAGGAQTMTMSASAGSTSAVRMRPRAGQPQPDRAGVLGVVRDADDQEPAARVGVGGGPGAGQSPASPPVAAPAGRPPGRPRSRTPSRCSRSGCSTGGAAGVGWSTCAGTSISSAGRGVEPNAAHSGGSPASSTTG